MLESLLLRDWVPVSHALAVPTNHILKVPLVSNVQMAEQLLAMGQILQASACLVSDKISFMRKLRDKGHL